MQVSLVKYHCLQSLQLYEEQAITGKLKKHARKHVSAILTTFMETKLWCLIVNRTIKKLQYK